MTTDNLLSFDIEGFIESSHDLMTVPPQYLDEPKENEEIIVNTQAYLDLLDEHQQKGTFFVLGRIGRDLPKLVAEIASRGHEVGCHSFHHRRMYDFDAKAVQTFLADARKCLEDAAGTPIRGFRSPDFSITKKNLWCFDLLREAGFTYDSSVMPTGLHDVYGIGDFPRHPFRMANGLIEFPLSVAPILGKNLPFGGGGYMRLYPAFLNELFFRRINREGLPGIVYLHPFEIGVRVTRIREMPMLRKFRTYVGVKTVARKLSRLLRRFRFVTFADYIEHHPIEETAHERA